ncbi:MAG: hypothetical protein COT91_01250 [Candidatus Doudnabacteria bacterium CG10_big_fil_rev_8_21_14_0_10_41_10]|uniref:Uncharacterized protein n=1 Tax=Candidatus Doudnabacteria bacterium CG10_big_fil_rev_8_21_14_0_10_41_10 TaxID=1974551 RepID=A0A2H0VGL3_9BACT|nr:MAG: hypothetical protein COT91_01250 [Candidatus Doudnabacteria bacterium CG10_big_fil_rev_8_21_14_0_10_41_10]
MKLSLNTISQHEVFERGVDHVNPNPTQLEWVFQIFLSIKEKLGNIAEMVEVVKMGFRQFSFETKYPLVLDIEVILAEPGEVPHPRRKIIVKGEGKGYWQESNTSATKLPDEVADDITVRVKGALSDFATNLRLMADHMDPNK